jgi:hypothetical protein
MTDPIDGVIGTIGLEFESEIVPSSLEIDGWKNTHDASNESVIYRSYTTGLPILKTEKNTRLMRRFRALTSSIGREYVSRPYFSMEDLEEDVYYLLNTLVSRGERTENRRGSIHVHVGWSYDLETLHRTVQMSAWLESLMFHLGGMGYEFRGVFNNSAYCRPITSFGPPVASTNLGRVQIMNMEALLSSSSITSFWNRYGGVNYEVPPKRYSPMRYMAWNLFSVFLHKTLEFRMFNTTLNPQYIMAVVELCKSLAKFTMSETQIPDRVNSVYEITERGENHNILTELLRYIRISPVTEKYLRGILEASPVPILEKKFIRTHLEDIKYTLSFSQPDIGKVKNLYQEISSYDKPGILDVHMLEEVGNRGGHDFRLKLIKLDTSQYRKEYLESLVLNPSMSKIYIEQGIDPDIDPDIDMDIDPDIDNEDIR